MSKEKEELLLRALNTSDTALQPQDLSRLVTLVTPPDVRVYSRLTAGGTVRATGLTHEWVEGELTTNFTAGAYADGGIPTDVANTHARKSNKLMSVGRVAKATGLMNAIDVLTNMNGRAYRDAFALELAEKMMDFMRVLEYFLINGDKANTSPQEMDGLLKTITTNVTPVNGALTETALRTALKQCYDAGGVPTAIYCRPAVALKIASFTENKVQYNVNVGQTPETVGGVATYKYASPFGGLIDVVPVRTDFLPSGRVIVLQENDARLAFASTPEVDVMDLPVTTDAQAKLIKSYLTLEHRAERHSALLTGVLDSF